MANQGQCCCAASKTFVHEDIYDAFIAKCKEFATNRVCGDPFSNDTQHGPQVCRFIGTFACTHTYTRARAHTHSLTQSHTHIRTHTYIPHTYTPHTCTHHTRKHTYTHTQSHMHAPNDACVTKLVRTCTKIFTYIITYSLYSFCRPIFSKRLRAKNVLA